MLHYDTVLLDKGGVEYFYIFIFFLVNFDFLFHLEPLGLITDLCSAQKQSVVWTSQMYRPTLSTYRMVIALDPWITNHFHSHWQNQLLHYGPIHRYQKSCHNQYSHNHDLLEE